jgi:hypothetical protein
VRRQSRSRAGPTLSRPQCARAQGCLQQLAQRQGEVTFSVRQAEPRLICLSSSRRIGTLPQRSIVTQTHVSRPRESCAEEEKAPLIHG